MDIRDEIAVNHEGVLFAEGFDKACIGVAHRACNTTVVAYDYDRCVEILLEEGMTLEDVIEHLEYNVLGAYVGEMTPIFIQRYGDGTLNLYGEVMEC